MEDLYIKKKALFGKRDHFPIPMSISLVNAIL